VEAAVRAWEKEEGGDRGHIRSHRELEKNTGSQTVGQRLAQANEQRAEEFCPMERGKLKLRAERGRRLNGAFD